MTNPATTLPRNTSASIIYRKPTDGTEADAEFDFDGTTARTLPDLPGYAFTRTGWAVTLKGKTPKYMSPGKSDGAYRNANLRWQGRSKSFLLHRLIARAFLFNPEGKPQVNHLNGNPADNDVSNLEWVTAQENSDHRKTLGRKPRRSTPELRAKAVDLHEDGMKFPAIAEALNIHYRAIAKAVRKIMTTSQQPPVMAGATFDLLRAF